MIAEVIAGISTGLAVLNGCVVYLMYKEYMRLADASLEFAGIVIESIREENGEIKVEPMALAGLSFDHMIQLSSLWKWIKR